MRQIEYQLSHGTNPTDARAEQRFWRKVDKSDADACWLWTGAKNDSGYGKLTVGSKRAYRAHRFSYQLANGPIPEGLNVLHRCDVRACVRPDHLFLGTTADNNKDAASKGRSKGGQPKGSAHPKAVLDEEIVVEIRSLRRHRDLSPGRIARRLGLKRSTVKNVIYGGYWSHVNAKAA